MHPNTRHEDAYNWFVLEAMGTMDYDAMTLGELELYRGVEYVERIIADSKVPITLANVTFTGSGERIGEEYLIREVDGVKIAITGLLGQDFGEGVEKFEELGFTVADPFQVANELVPRLDEMADLVLVMAHMGSADTFQLPKQVPGIDLLVFGHYPGTVASTQVEGAVTIRSGQRGQYLGETRIVVNPEDEIVSYVGKAVPILLDQVCIDEDLEGKLQVIHDEAKADQKRAELEREIDQDANKLVLGQDHYLGDLKCARCHFDIYKSWQETRHAQAWQSLVAEKREADAECMSCHVTGYREPGGFRGVGADQDMRNVQCEACHGMGTQHNGTMRLTGAGDAMQVGEQACLVCHDEENSPGFDYETYWAQIAHGLD
ncbi:MAG: multiheme c-type cytochrome [Candidatus Eiseniibacteriota bacterium]